MVCLLQAPIDNFELSYLKRACADSRIRSLRHFPLSVNIFLRVHLRYLASRLQQPLHQDLGCRVSLNLECSSSGLLLLACALCFLHPSKLPHLQVEQPPARYVLFVHSKTDVRSRCRIWLTVLYRSQGQEPFKHTTVMSAGQLWCKSCSVAQECLKAGGESEVLHKVCATISPGQEPQAYLQRLRYASQINLLCEWHCQNLLQQETKWEAYWQSNEAWMPMTFETRIICV